MACEELKARYTKLFKHFEDLVAENKADPGSVPNHILMSAGEASYVAGILYRECITPASVVQTAVDLNGRWFASGIVGPVISVAMNVISIDMSKYNRPKAHGIVHDPTHITVTFPDDNTFTATLVKESYTGLAEPPEFIDWSNGTRWSKVYPRIVNGPPLPLNELVAQ